MDDPTPGDQRPMAPKPYVGAVLALLVLTYTFNFIDRTVINTIGQAIKVDLKLTDAQLGLLGGFSFAVLYTVLGLPIARLAERFNRVTIISLALVVWSGFTALCGTAVGFTQLLAFRIGVGVGEAGCSPPAHSLISDYFPPERRSSALSVYAFGIPLGAMIGAAVGGWLAQALSWRIAFIVVGLPGLVLAALVKLFIKEPLRGASDPSEAGAHVPHRAGSAVGGLRREIGEILAVAGTLFGRWPILNLIMGVTIASFGSYGSTQFAAPYFIRTFGLGYAQVGLIIGLMMGISGGLGTLAGGFIADWAGKRSAAWYGLVPAAGLIIAAPIYILGYSQPSWPSAAAILLIPGFFLSAYLGPTFGVVQNAVAPGRRATATALLFFALNFIALGFGPPFTGWMIDHFAAFGFEHPTTGLWRSLLGALTHEGTFALTCPGGGARPGATAEAAAKCHGVLAVATRRGIMVSIGFYWWAAVHYLIASVGLARASMRWSGAAR
jgi:MFS family permease